jgi:tetratricopeptide (TPR) repeat protein
MSDTRVIFDAELDAPEDLPTDDIPSRTGSPAAEGTEMMAQNPPGAHFAERPVVKPAPKPPIIALVAVLLVVAAIAFAAGRFTAPGDSSAAGSTPNSASSDANAALLTQGLAKHNAGDLVGAAAIYNQILSTDAKNQYALFNLGVIAQTNKNYDEAVTKYTAAIAVDGKFYSALYNLGLTYAAKGDRTNAIAFLRKAVDADPKAAQAYYNLGTLLVQDGKNDEGAALLAKSFELNPTLKPKAEAPATTAAPATTVKK